MGLVHKSAYFIESDGHGLIIFSNGTRSLKLSSKQIAYICLTTASILGLVSVEEFIAVNEQIETSDIPMEVDDSLATAFAESNSIDISDLPQWLVDENERANPESTYEIVLQMNTSRLRPDLN
jgi:hypothetical protein